MFACELLFEAGSKCVCFVSASFRLQDVNSTSGRTVCGIYTFFVHVYAYACVLVCKCTYVECVHGEVDVTKLDDSDVTITN